MIFGTDFAANIEKLMHFENNCVGATLSSVAAMYNHIIIINGLCIIADVLPCNSNDAL